MDEASDLVLKALLGRVGDYVMTREINGVRCGLLPQMYTWGLFVGIDEMGNYEYRYCFKDFLDAAHAITTWDGTGHPENFIVRKGLGRDLRAQDV